MEDRSHGQYYDGWNYSLDAAAAPVPTSTADDEPLFSPISQEQLENSLFHSGANVPDSSGSINPADLSRGADLSWQKEMNSSLFTRHRSASDARSDISSNAASPYSASHHSFETSPNLDRSNLRPQGFLEADFDAASWGLGEERMDAFDGPKNLQSPGYLSTGPQFGLTASSDATFSDKSLLSQPVQAQAEYPVPTGDVTILSNEDADGRPSISIAPPTPHPEIEESFFPFPSINVDHSPDSNTSDEYELQQEERRLSAQSLRASRRRRANSESYVNPPSPHSPFLNPQSPESTSGERRRSVSSNRDYILDLATSQRSGGRQQKHPATFQCELCDKKFTRAYNLRSHLRTHTDERPFVCSLCGKAFARQHDRKRHEGLHTGEKRYACRGQLKDGTVWGCGKKFARADALGRHFRSEAGKECIQPLFEEENAEKEGTLEENEPSLPTSLLLLYPGLQSRSRAASVSSQGSYTSENDEVDRSASGIFTTSGTYGGY